MISANKLRTNLFPVFRVAALTNVGFEVVYKGAVYDFSVTKTNKLPERAKPNKNRKRKVGLDAGLLPLDTCPLCTELMVSNVCLNKRCTNSHV